MFLFHVDPNISICVILLTNRQAYSHEFNASLAEIIITSAKEVLLLVA